MAVAGEKTLSSWGQIASVNSGMIGILSIVMPVGFLPFEGWRWVWLRWMHVDKKQD